MCELFHGPARCLTDDEDRRYTDTDDSLTEEESQDQSVVRAMLIAVKVRLSIPVEQIYT